MTNNTTTLTIGSKVAILLSGGWFDTTQYEIVSETKTCWILNNGKKFVKNTRKEYGKTNEFYCVSYICDWEDVKDRIVKQMMDSLTRQLSSNIDFSKVDINMLFNFETMIKNARIGR